MKKSGVLIAVLLVGVISFWALRSNKPKAPATELSETKAAPMNPTAEPFWWTELRAAPENSRVFVRLKYQATFTATDVTFLQHVVETRNGQDIQLAAGILAAMLRGRFPAIMPVRQSLGADMLTLAANKYPEDERARYALTVLTYADRDAASQLVSGVDFSHVLPEDYRKVVAQQLSSINTDASLAKLDQLLAAQNDAKLGLFTTRRSARYVPVEELGRRWQEKHDIATLNLLADEWLQQVYEGYPLEEVVAIMGQPQKQGPHYAYYVSKEGPEFYLELNDARQIGGLDGPR